MARDLYIARVSGRKDKPVVITKEARLWLGSALPFLAIQRKLDLPIDQSLCLAVARGGDSPEKEHLFDQDFFAQVDLQPRLARLDRGFPARENGEIAIDRRRSVFVIPLALALHRARGMNSFSG